MKGYELYLVEQWACSRNEPTFVVVTYTGDPSHQVVVSILSVPTDQDIWSERLRRYFHAAKEHHARTQETPLGNVLVTNLSWVPSALTVILVPDGDFKRHREDIIVNEDLKRLGCSGRAGVNFAPPTDATQAKFYRLYKVNDRVRLSSAVKELVLLCQMALNAFGKLTLAYADGLLCDLTEDAINDWWADIGTDFHGAEPRDGVLGPTTVAALLGMLTGARNRLAAYGAPVAKDPLELDALRRGVTFFQKSQKIAVSHQLDHQTLERLHRVTAKAASGEGWIVPKTVKSTVAELGGKGGDMVMGMVGARDKPGMAEVESTLDFDQFVRLLRGERCKWLWYGKPRRSLESADVGGAARSDDAPSSWRAEPTGLRWFGGTHRPFHGAEPPPPPPSEPDLAFRDPTRTASEPLPGALNDDVARERDRHRSRLARTKIASRRNDPRGGLERIKDAVSISGRRGRHHPSSTDEIPEMEHDHQDSDRADLDVGPSSVASRAGSVMESWQDSDLALSTAVTPIRSMVEAIRREREAEDARARAQAVDTLSASATSPGPELGPTRHSRQVSTSNELTPATSRLPDVMPSVEDDMPGQETSASSTPCPDSTVIDVTPMSDGSRRRRRRSVPLRRTESLSHLSLPQRSRRNSHWWPRHLSFASAEEAVLRWKEVSPFRDDDLTAGPDPVAVDVQRVCQAEEDRQKYVRLVSLKEQVASWVRQKLEEVEALESQAMEDQDHLYTLYSQRSKAYETILASLKRTLPQQKDMLMESIRALDVSGAKLDYEVNALIAKVQDVDDGVEGIERHVEALEMKAQDFEREERQRQESWFRWATRFVAGIGR